MLPLYLTIGFPECWLDASGNRQCAFGGPLGAMQGSPIDPNYSSIADIFNSLMPYIFAVSGIMLLFLIISSGFTLLTSAGNPDGMKKGQQRLTAALVGFIIVFAAFWIYQLIQVFIGYQF